MPSCIAADKAILQKIGVGSSQREECGNGHVHKSSRACIVCSETGRVATLSHMSFVVGPVRDVNNVMSLVCRREATEIMHQNRIGESS